MNESWLEIKEQHLLENCSYNLIDNNQIRGERIYSFLEKISIRQNSFFYLKYISTKSHSLILNGIQYTLPSTDAELIYLVPLIEGSELDYFTINIHEDAGIEDQFFESGINTYENTSNIFPDKNILIYSDNVYSLNFKILGADELISLVFESDNNADYNNLSIHTANSADINKLSSYLIQTRKGTNQYWFYGNQTISSIDTITIEKENTVLYEIEFNQKYSSEQALPVDLEEFINWDIDLWRKDDYELFRWDLFPDMLLIDTKSYKIQSSFLKRLAFFTEKKISAGELLSEEELAPLHGWNAHDYKAEDLARFFNEADKLGFQLNEYELLLKDILLNNQILKKSGNRLRPLKGGILSISRESTERLRWLFLTHEGYHGIFFSSYEYAGKVTEIWNDLSDEEKDFWRIFLGLYGYNVSDNFLLINEFQAYLMQQDTISADSYFRSKISWILDIKPFLRPQMEYLLSEYGDTFSENAKTVEDTAYSLTGIKAGDLVLKRKK